MTALIPRSWFPSLSGRNGEDFFSALHKEVDRVFDDFGRVPSSVMAYGAITPRLNVSEMDKAMEIEAELAGVDEKDIEVALDDDVLTIKGEKKTEREEKKKDYHLQERTFGSFARSVTLPFTPDPAAVKASFGKGVLKITLPKPAGAKAKTTTIPIAPIA